MKPPNATLYGGRGHTTTNLALNIKKSMQDTRKLEMRLYLRDKKREGAVLQGKVS